MLDVDFFVHARLREDSIPTNVRAESGNSLQRRQVGKVPIPSGKVRQGFMGAAASFASVTATGNGHGLNNR
jgi:hypothetical protein